MNRRYVVLVAMIWCGAVGCSKGKAPPDDAGAPVGVAAPTPPPVRRIALVPNATPLKVYKAQFEKGKPTEFNVWATLSDYYNYEFGSAKRTHFSIRLEDDKREDVTGYVLKSSEDGKALFELLKDGRRHPVRVTLAYSPKGAQSSIAVIEKYHGWGGDLPADATLLGPMSDNPMPLRTFKALMDVGQPQAFRLRAVISDYYNYDFSTAKASHYSIAFSDSSKQDIYGYVPKDSDDGKKLFALLSDGEKHDVKVELAYTARSQKADIASVVRVLELAPPSTRRSFC